MDARAILSAFAILVALFASIVGMVLLVAWMIWCVFGPSADDTDGDATRKR